MLSDPDKDYIIEVLVRLVAPLEKPRETLATAFINTTFAQDLIQGMPQALVISAVQLCIIDAWNNNPIWLERLLGIFRLKENDAKIAEILEKVRHKPPSAPDPLDSTILNNGTPFVSRLPLRLNLRRLAGPTANARPILVVNGIDKSGKTYSTNYIEHFSYVKPPIITYSIELDPELGLEMGAKEVAREFVSLMGRSLDSMPESDTNQKLYARQLALWVLNEAAQSPAQQWFILDNFRGDSLRPDTRDLLIALSDRITTGVFSQKCRLILIGFDKALLTVKPGKVEEENIGVCSTNEIESCIGEILQLAPVPIAVPRISPFILLELPSGKHKMAELNQRLQTLIYAIREVRQILLSLPEVDYEQFLLEMLKDLPSDQEERMTELQKRLEELRESVVES